MSKKNNHNSDLLIAANEPFPRGMAATNRFTTYAEQIAKVKRVSVLLLKPTETEGKVINNEATGVYKGINFRYLHNTTIWPPKGFKLKKATIRLKTFYLLISYFFRYRTKTVLLVSNKLEYIWFLWLLSKVFKFKYFQEKSELPPVMKNKASFLYTMLYLKSYRIFDGILVMTHQLVHCFRNLKQNNLFHLPMTVDINRFTNFEQSKQYSVGKKIVFTYAGGGVYYRDGLKQMVDAFMESFKTIQNFEFNIYGPVNMHDKYLAELFKLVEDRNASGYIKFRGRVDSSKMPSVLQEADCLIMTPPTDFDSGGFPTKLGEFLATGKPVICTKVSEIPLYLNSENCVLLIPDNHSSLVNAICDIVKNYKNYEYIGLNGKKAALKHFNVETYVDGLIKFLKL